MKLPRNISGDDLAKLLGREFGYTFVSQRGSHMRYATDREGRHVVIIPKHDFLKIGTLSSILKDVEEHFQMRREDILRKLFED